jgi:hypothetical protein
MPDMCSGQLYTNVHSFNLMLLVCQRLGSQAHVQRVDSVNAPNEHDADGPVVGAGPVESLLWFTVHGHYHMTLTITRRGLVGVYEG